MRTYLFRPVGGGRYPGLVLYSEIFQVTGPIRRMAAMLASHGFVVAVPEIFHELEPAGTVLPYDEAGAARGNRHKITKTLSSYDDDTRATLDYLASSPHCTGKLGVDLHWGTSGISRGNATRCAGRSLLLRDGHPQAQVGAGHA